MRINNGYSTFAKTISRFCGRPRAFTFALTVVIVWILTGPIFNFSDTWQLVINDGTTIITFLMVFLIQNTQNRDTGAIQLKLDELIRATRGAQNALLDLEKLEEENLVEFKMKYQALVASARNSISQGSFIPTHPSHHLNLTALFYKSLHLFGLGKRHFDTKSHEYYLLK